MPRPSCFRTWESSAGANPGIALEIGTTDRRLDHVREGVDCVVRAGEPRDAGLVSRRVALARTVTCASRGYVEEHGLPRTIEQFRAHQAVNFISTATGKHSPFQFTVKGKVQSLALKGRVAVTSTEAYAACCLQGLGSIQAPHSTGWRKGWRDWAPAG